MLIILEGLDKSGKTTIANALHRQLHGSLLIRKTYCKELYPIDYGKASEYDWQAILDRVVLANPEATFIADRSFFTQTVYQICLGTGQHAITKEQVQMFNNYCDAIKLHVKHLIVYCHSVRYELDSMVTNLTIKNKLNEFFVNSIKGSGLNNLILDMDACTFADTNNKILTAINDLLKA